MRYKCDNCGKEFESSIPRRKGSGTYCSLSCAATKTQQGRKKTDEARRNISEGVKRARAAQRESIPRVCAACGDVFHSTRSFRKDRPIHCDKCRRNVAHAKDVSSVKSIKEFSSRTVANLLRRGRCACAMCGWNEAACDVHHIVSRKNKGGDEHTNLIVLCPNCHRKVHSNVAGWSTELLMSRSIATLGIDLISLYNPTRNKKRK